MCAQLVTNPDRNRRQSGVSPRQDTRMHSSTLVNKIMKQALFSGLLLAFSHNSFALHISELLNNMSSADSTLNYEGVFVLRKADRMMSMRVSHAADETGVREILETLNGEPRRVIRNNDEVLSIYPERKLVIVSEDASKSRLHPRLPENLDSLQSYYDISQLPDDRIADHQTAVLQLSPRDKHRYGYRYWVDADTGVLLRCDLTDDNNAVIEQMMFTQLQYTDAPPDASFQLPELNDFAQTHLSKNRTVLDEAPWRINNLPPGFVLTQSSKQQTGDAEITHLVYSDGLSSVSVFIEPGKSGKRYLSGASNMGALNAYGVRHGDFYITVMGEAPAKTVEQIALSTEYLGEEEADDEPEPEIGD